MKKNILGLAAIAIALFASAFTTPSKATSLPTGDYWFSISGSVTSNSVVPPADATFIQQSSTPPTESCSGSTYQCVSGFTASQVNTSTNTLKSGERPDMESQLHN